METNSKLREALEFIKLASDDYEKYGNTKAGALDAIHEKACAALAEPIRNCDLDEVAENPEAAWLDDEDNWDEWGSPKLSIDKWLLAPAKKGGEDE